MKPESNILSLHGPQWEVFQDQKRFRVLAAGRQFGKTELALADIVRTALEPNKLIWYLAPTDEQAESILWDRLKEMTQQFWAKPALEEKHRIDLLTGSKIFLKGAYKPSKLRGHGLDLVVMDEFAQFPKDAWRRVIRPTLVSKRGRALFLGTPEGRNHFYDCFERGKLSDSEASDWRSFHFKTADAGIVDPAELEDTKEDLDANAYRQEMEAEFGTVGLHQVYTAFDRGANLKEVGFDPMQGVIWSMDFNVNPMCMLLMQEYEKTGIVHVIEEIVIKPNATTEQACQEFLKRAEPWTKKVDYFHIPLRVKIYGDSSGRQRRTSSNTTDWVIIRDFFKMWVGTFLPNILVPESNPAVRDRVNCVNARLRNQHGEHRLFIDPKCKELIRDLEEVSWELDAAGNSTGEISKKDNSRTHMSDALGYFLAKNYPLKGTVGPQSKPLPLF